MKVYSTKPTRTILDNLGSPDERLKIIHIAGTNGKGSTAEFFTSVLIAAGKRVGTFTSPAVYGYYDQFKVNGKPLTADKFGVYLKAAEIADDGSASEFERETAAALYAFMKEGCEYAVIECGMGGLNDATNAVREKLLAVITSISLEHTQFLGGTVEEICAQKAGIIKRCPAVVNAHQSQEALNYFTNLGATVAGGVTNIDGCRFEYRGNRYELSVEGSLQCFNAATAIEGALLLGIDEKAVFEGTRNAKPRGRLEIFRAFGRTYILDGAHNPAAFEPLQNLLKDYQPEEVTIIFGCLSDKDIDGNLEMLNGLAAKIIAVRCPSPRARDLNTTAEFCRKYFKNVACAESVDEALSKAESSIVAVCGSFTLLNGAKQWIEQTVNDADACTQVE